MNIYEDEQLEKKLGEITDQFGYLLLDLFQVSLKKINHENMIYKELEDARNFTDSENVPF